MDELTVDGFTIRTLEHALMHVTWTGDATAAAFNAMYDYAAARRAELGEDAQFDCIVDAREATGFRREARSVIVDRGKEKPWRCVGLVGVRYEVKVLLELLSRAMSFIRSERATLGFFDTEAEAKAWIEASAEARAQR